MDPYNVRSCSAVPGGGGRRKQKSVELPGRLQQLECSWTAAGLQLGGDAGGLVE